MRAKVRGASVPRTGPAGAVPAAPPTGPDRRETIDLREPAPHPEPPATLEVGDARFVHGGWVCAAALTFDGGLAATGGSNGELRVWDRASATPYRTSFLHGSWILALAFAPDGRRLASTGSDGSANLWDLGTGAGLPLRAHEGSARAVAFDAESARVATGGSDGLVRVSATADGREVAVLTHGDPVRAVAFSPTRDVLATAGARGVTRLWDLRTRTEIGRLASATAVHAVAFSRDGNLVTTAMRDGSLAVWDAERGALLGGVARDATHAPAWTIALSPFAQRLATGGADGIASIRDAYGRELAHVAHGAPIRAIAFCADAITILTSGGDGSAVLWSLPRQRSFVEQPSRA
jgi:WD40 repeat protein